MRTRSRARPRAATSSVRPPTSTRVTPAARSTTRGRSRSSRRRRSAPPPRRPAPGRRAPSSSSCWIRPPISTATRSASACASPRSCVTSTVVTRSWRSTAPRSAMSAVARSACRGPRTARRAAGPRAPAPARAPAPRAAPRRRTAFAPAGAASAPTPRRSSQRRHARRGGLGRRRRGSAGRARRCRRRSCRPAAAPGTPWPSGAARPARRARRPAGRGSARCPRVRALQQSEHAQQRGLAAAVGADDASSSPAATSSAGTSSTKPRGDAPGARRAAASDARSRRQHVDRAAVDRELPAPVALDLEDLVDQVRHLDLVDRSRPEPAAPGASSRMRSVQVVPKSSSATTTPRMRFMWCAASAGPRSLRMSRTYSGRMKNAIGASGGGR